MEGDFQFEDDIFEESKQLPNNKQPTPYSPNCSGCLEFLSAPDEESQKAACDWFYLHGQYKDCLERVDLILSVHSDDCGGFVRKSFLDYKIRCSLRLGLLGSLCDLMHQHASAVLSREDLIGHLLLHRDCSIWTGNNQDLLHTLQCLLLFLSPGSVPDSVHRGRPIAACQTEWWTRVALLWNRVKHNCARYYPVWFADVSRVLANLTTDGSECVDTGGCSAQKNPYEETARRIIASGCVHDGTTEFDTAAENECPLCRDHTDFPAVFHERFVAPFESLHAG